MNDYFLGYRSAELERLQRQALELAQESKWLFDQIPLPSRASVIEIGCGPHGCLELLSDLVGPSGRVVGVELSADAVTHARKMIAERTLRNVEVVHGDARSTGLPRNSFDFASTRLVLVNIPKPEEVIEEAVALVRPGGWVAFHEADYLTHVCDPPSEAWDTLIGLLVAYSKSRGIDLFMGRKMPRLLREIGGLTDIRVNPIVHVYPTGHTRRNILLDFVEDLAERFIAEGLIGEHRIFELKDALCKHLENPDTLIVSHLFFQVWGRKPV